MMKAKLLARQVNGSAGQDECLCSLVGIIYGAHVDDGSCHRDF